jgi:hypothetical protein
VQPLYDHVAIASWRGAVTAGPALLAHWLKRTIKQTPILWAAAVKLRTFAARLRRTPAASSATEEEAQ